MNLVLCCDTDSTYLEQILLNCGDIMICKGDYDRPPCVELEYYLEKGNRCDLVIVALDGAAGMINCQYIRKRRKQLPLLWISEQESFYKESLRIEVEGFLIKPVRADVIIKSIEYCYNKIC